MNETPTFEEIARREKARRQLARILRQHLWDEHGVGLWLPQGWQHAAVDAILTDRVSTLEALGLPAADAIARAIMTSKDGTPQPAGYVVGHDDGRFLRTADTFAAFEAARDEATARGEGWAVYAAYPVGERRDG